MRRIMVIWTGGPCMAGFWSSRFLSLGQVNDFWDKKKSDKVEIFNCNGKRVIAKFFFLYIEFKNIYPIVENS